MNHVFLGVEIGEPESARPAARPGPAASDCARAAKLAERGSLAFVTLGEVLTSRSDSAPGRQPLCQSRLNPVATLAHVAPQTTSIGLVATATVSYLEPFHVSKALATLDHVSSGRAGWCVQVSRSAEEAQLFGDRSARDLPSRYEEAVEFVEVVSRLWDSWEDGAEIRDAATGRFLDRARIRAVNHQGRYFQVKGPGIVPRPPQGHPVTAVRITSDEDLPLAARADMVFGRLERIAGTRPRLRGETRIIADLFVDCRGLPAGQWAWEAGGAAQIGDVRAFADFLEARARTGLVDGFRLVFADVTTELSRFVDEAVPELRTRRLVSPWGPGCRSFRERLGLPHTAPNSLVP
ncbi:alkanesulfonate monooxygenase SsuD/methylene tetrahydromethanopterin reductase-like flavin-dependent oxidoreductase (luciferase family) [Kitasatospora sp. MAA4]|uniref:LLM class flavin-dependent oxidoreductase n=1 Tax=Kitasatospora sp. MAA4 TaxID=3035093 RepID=UPI0024750187|nr:LLM class flavin-dependent oxidoreductase [Kitasatospora sp. MAA4]MDH6130921.1 alkanesulfonate monooxygenase SsuD/methylene tetrahydromethanopterin reductase-like flavin-dependent oxidoreductase (luciferase family) [Kitasatospora sp. MAA4]